MKRTIKFEKVNGLWYAILPDYLTAGGSFSDCLMVENAPEMLDALSGNFDDVTVEVSDYLVPNADLILELQETRNDAGHWGYYDVMENDLGWYPKGLIGLCPVNTFVWGEHPQTISIKKVNL